MKILIVGGGSGGHITPAVAVMREILIARPRTTIEFWTDRKYYKNVTKIATEMGAAWGHVEKKEARKRGATGQYIRVRKIPAGKFHRYAGWKLRDYFEHLDVTIFELIWGNLKGLLGFLGGIMVSFVRLVALRPDAIFLKGGYVCLPVGMMAKLLKIPYVIHESDAVPGLANRLLMKKAEKVAFGVPIAEDDLAEHKNYVWTGIPVGSKFRKISPVEEEKLKKKLSFDPEKPLVMITGGSQGSENLDEVTKRILPELLKFTQVGLIAGRKYYETVVDLKKYEVWEKAKLTTNFRLWEFDAKMDELMGAADVVISRAGATTIAELSALSKAVILVPFERLPGGHQVKNAERLEKLGAAEVVLDSVMMTRPETLLEKTRSLVRSPRRRAEMAEKLHAEARPDAAKNLAEIVIEVAENGRRK